MGRSPGFASTPIDIFALFRLGFPVATARKALTKANEGKSSDHYAKGTPSPWYCYHRAPTACRHVVSGSVSSLTGVLPIFRSRYLFTIGRQRVFSLGRWASRIQTRFHVTGFTRGLTRSRFAFAYGTVTLCGCAFHHNSAGKSFCNSVLVAPQPRRAEALRFGLFPFRSPLLGKSNFFFTFLRLLRCFSSPR